MFELENIEDIQSKQDDEALNKLASLVHAIFAINPLGKELLEKLKEKYLLAPVCQHNQPPSYGYYREGENHMIRNFYTLIQKHEYNLNKISEEK